MIRFFIILLFISSRSFAGEGQPKNGGIFGALKSLFCPAALKSSEPQNESEATARALLNSWNFDIEPDNGKTLADETRELTNQVNEVRAGARATISALPLNRKITFWEKIGTGFGRRGGHLLGTADGPEGRSLVVADVGDLSTVRLYPLTLVAPGEIVVKKILNSNERAYIYSKYAEAIATQKVIQFTSQNGKTDLGWVIKRGFHPMHAPYALVTEFGGFAGDLFTSEIDPRTVKLIDFEPRALNEQEQNFMNSLKRAQAEKKWVAFWTRDEMNRRAELHEGWAVGIYPFPSGEYVVHLNATSTDANTGLGYRLSAIDVGTLVVDPQATVTETERGFLAPRVEAFVEIPGWFSKKTKAVRVSKDLMAQLGVFADATKPSGLTLPQELKNLVGLGNEVRIYFAVGARRIRLTIRRVNDEVWKIGSTYSEPTYIEDENGSTCVGYRCNERSHLYDNQLQAQSLRIYIRIVRDEFLESGIETMFPETLKKWKQAVPEDYHDNDLRELLVRDQGFEFHFDRGFVFAKGELSERRAKKLAAIQHLVDNNLMFWPSKDSGSGIKFGLHAQGSVKLPGHHFRVWETFDKVLFESMEEAGLKYENGRWIK